MAPGSRISRFPSTESFGSVHVWVGRPGEHYQSERAGDSSLVSAFWYGRGWENMKNTGKRIFFSVVAFALVNISVFAMAGHLGSSR